jgi:Flp pilus assembly protein TadG
MTHPGPPRPRARRLRGDEGATTELVIAVPGLLFMILLIVQAGLYFHAIAVASAAAQDGAREASLATGSGTGPDVAAGEQVANDLLAAMAPDLLAGATATGQVVDGGEAVRMTVQGPVAQVVVIPGVDFSISVNEVAETPVEAFRPGGEVP